MDTTYTTLGSLASDLYRVASCVGRGSNKVAERFLVEAARWTQPLRDAHLPVYIQRILRDVDATPKNQPVTQADAEKYLMYSVLIQNYCVHARDNYA